MTVELLQLISLVSYVLAAVLFLLGLALFFLLDVPKLYGDISGKTSERRIEEIRKQNEESGNKAYKPSPVNEARGKLTDKISASGNLESRTSGLALNVGTEKFATGMLAPQFNETSVLESGVTETTLLDNGANETTVLTTDLPPVSNETTMLTANLPPASNETTLLVNEETQAPQAEATGEFTVDVEMAFTGSAEIIE